MTNDIIDNNFTNKCFLLGASEINISVVIPEQDMDKAIKSIHKDFLEEQ